MTTELIKVELTDGWRSLACTGTVVHIADVLGNSIRVRLGLLSTSDGFVMEPGDRLTANETVYVRANINAASKPSLVVVVKD